MVVEVGLTDTDPPLAPIARLLPLLPAMVMPVALVAVTVRTEELPFVIDVGLALIVTVGGPDPPDEPVVTVIMTEDEAVPPGPVAVAVYVVAEVGLTETDPPPAAMVRLLPLLPVMVIPVAFWATTVRTVEVPLVIDAGLALMETVGAGEPDAWPLKPTPANAGTAHGSRIERT